VEYGPIVRRGRDDGVMVTVVTGAAGFLGGVLVRTLLEEGRTVRAVDVRRGPALAGLDVELVQADVLDPTSLDRALDGADVVYHTAAIISVAGDPTGRVWAVNVDGVRAVATSALHAGVRRFVHCSSIHAFDLSAASSPITEHHPPARSPRLPVYDRSKAAGEAALRTVISAGLDAVIVNPTALIGPLDFGPSRMGTVILTMLRGRLPALVAGGFDWVDVRDVATSMVAAERGGRAGENYLLGGHHLSVLELALVIEEVSGVPHPPVTVPLWFARMWSPIADAVTRRTNSPLWYTHESLRALTADPRVSSAKASTTLGHRPRPISETIADLERWFRAQGLLENRRAVRQAIPAS
jgi:dihydroflavonol-4-reductase